MKIFLDANIFVAAVGNEAGGSAYLFRVAEKEKWTLITIPFAIIEARVNIRKKLSFAEEFLSHYITHPSLVVSIDAPILFEERCKDIVPKKDIPILAGAILSKSDFLCSLDLKDFHNEKVSDFSRKHGLKIKTPGQILEWYRRGKKK